LVVVDAVFDKYNVVLKLDSDKGWAAAAAAFGLEEKYGIQRKTFMVTLLGAMVGGFDRTRDLSRGSFFGS
jgi:hypothetical protein